MPWHFNFDSMKCNNCGAPRQNVKNKNCIFCGAVYEDALEVSLSQQAETKTRSVAALNDFFAKINGLNNDYISSYEGGILSKLFSKIEKSDIPERKLKLIENFEVETDDEETIKLFQFVVKDIEHSLELLKKSKSLLSSSPPPINDQRIKNAWKKISNETFSKVKKSASEKSNQKIQELLLQVNRLSE